MHDFGEWAAVPYLKTTVPAHRCRLDCRVPVLGILGSMRRAQRCEAEGVHPARLRRVDEHPAEQAGPGELRSILLEKLALGQLSYRDVGCIAWAVRGRGLDVDDLAVTPATSGGSFSKQIQGALNFDEQQLYYTDLPVWRRGRRVVVKWPFLLPHERVALKARLARIRTNTQTRSHTNCRQIQPTFAPRCQSGRWGSSAT